MTAIPPTMPPTLTIVPTTKPVGNPFFRYLVGTLFIAFAMAMGLLLAYFKQPITTVDGALILVPLVLGFASVSESTLNFVLTKAQPLVPWNRRKDDPQP